MSVVSYKQENFIGIVTIERPEALNALNSQVLDELSSVFTNINLETTRVVLLTGSGTKSFVAGADIAEMSTLNSDEGTKFGYKGNEIFRKIETFPLPVIAVINGFALGGGCELAMSCDFRICSENAVFGQPEVGLGITPGFGGTQRLARLIGLGKAKEMIYTGNAIKADEALNAGLVNHVYPQETLLEEAKKFINKFIYTTVDEILTTNAIKEYKTLVQEFAQAKFDITPTYEIIDEYGLDHEKTFIVWIYFWTELKWQWNWSSKKKAQESAAKDAYLKLNSDENI